MQDYLHSLGKARTAQVQKDARIGEAKNKRDAVIRVRHDVSNRQETILHLKRSISKQTHSVQRRCFVSCWNFKTNIVWGGGRSPTLLLSSSVIFAPQEAHAMQEKVSAQYKNEIYMAKAQRDYELKKAAYDIEVNTKKAESEMAYQLQVFTWSCQR